MIVTYLNTMNNGKYNVNVGMCIYIYNISTSIYIYIERDREREKRDREQQPTTGNQVWTIPCNSWLIVVNRDSKLDVALDLATKNLQLGPSS